MIKDDIMGSIDKFKYKYFFRSGLCCVLGYDENQEYYAYIGFLEDHDLYNRRFKRVKHITLYSMLGQDFSFKNDALDDRWWLGFKSASPFSHEATLRDLKLVVDELGDGSNQEEAVSDSQSPGGFEFL